MRTTIGIDPAAGEDRTVIVCAKRCGKSLILEAIAERARSDGQLVFLASRQGSTTMERILKELGW